MAQIVYIALRPYRSVLLFCPGCTSTLSWVGEKLSDDEVDALLSGIEDSQGQVNYEGIFTHTAMYYSTGTPCN